MSAPLRRLALSTARLSSPRPALAPQIYRYYVPIARGMANQSDSQRPQRYREYEYEEEEDMFKPWEFNDISSTAHAELDQHREARHYARIAAYEMPRLSQLAKTFEPPSEGQILRFRYTTYFGEQHPAESKVVLEFAPVDLGLEPIQRAKLVKLAGVRYNPEKQVVRMSCEMFEHQAQNKRYLSDLLDKLIAAARDPTDTFEDIPFDFRHHKYRKEKPKFPYEWVDIAQKKKEARLQKKASVVE